MKKIICLISLICLIWIRPVLATDSTPSAAQDLLDRVATRVANLAAKLRRVYTGQIKSVGTNSYVITTPEGDHTITTNDVTNFFRIRASNRTEVNFNSLKVGDDLTAIGTIDPDTTEMTAKQIIAKVKRYNITGRVTAIDKTIYTITEINGPVTKVDFSDSISLKSLNSIGQITPISISAIKKGDVIFVLAYILNHKSDILSVLKAVQLIK